MIFSFTKSSISLQMTTGFRVLGSMRRAITEHAWSRTFCISFESSKPRGDGVITALDCAQATRNAWQWERLTMPENLRGLIVYLLLPFVAASVGAFAKPGPWYSTLPKPSWTPPGWIFGPVWTVLYTMMGIAAWLVWKKVGWWHPALRLFYFQLLLNALWSPLFFGFRRPDLAFVDIVLLECAIIGTTIAFWRISQAAGVLFLPYLAWVSFATVLNFAVWRMWQATS
jgi:tryptophan-rich sensory protein